jgi:hypothetical protein
MSPHYSTEAYSVSRRLIERLFAADGALDSDQRLI